MAGLGSQASVATTADGDQAQPGTTFAYSNNGAASSSTAHTTCECPKSLVLFCKLLGTLALFVPSHQLREEAHGASISSS